MALAYLTDPQLQYSDKSGALNVAGFLRVYINGTDDRAVTYKDFNGTLNTADIVLDDNGRAVVIADSSKTYRLEVYNRLGGLMWTQYPINTIVGGAGGADGIVVESTDGSIQVDKYNAGGLVHFDLSTEGAQELEWTRTDSFLIEESAEGMFLLPVNQAEGNMDVDGTGILLKANVHYDVSMFINIEAPSTAVNRFEGLQFRVGGPDAPVAAVTFDNSYAHRQVACLSCDVHPRADTRLRVYVEGLANGAVLSCSQCTVHSLATSYTSVGGGETYTAGNGINIDSENEISVDSSVVALKSDLSQYVTDSEMETILSGYATASDLQAGLATKQDTISDLSAIRAGAQAGATAVQPAALNDYATTSAMNTALATKQDTLTAGNNITISNNVISATVDPQVQADWTENDSSSPAYIKHRPDLDAYATDAELAAGLATKQGVINDLDQIRSGAAAGSTAVQPAVLAPVATTGDYDSLTNKPTIPSGTQLVPAATSVDADKVLTVDSQGVPAWAAAQAPITVDQTYDPTSTNPQSGTAVAGAVAGKQDTLTAGSNISISGSTISATDTTYSAGTGLDLTGTTFSVDSTTVAMKSDLPDLTDYVTDSELSTILQGYQEALTAGSNIQISNGTISATDTTYTAGTGLDLTGTVFSVDTTTIATKSDLSSYTPTSSLAAVALSNDYDDLSNKPTIPVVPPTKELVAGSNITITEGANDVTVACTVTIGTVSI